MTAIAVDTLAIVKKLIAHGFSREQAEAWLEAAMEIMGMRSDRPVTALAERV